MNLTGTNCFSIEFARIRILKDHPYTQHYFKLRIAGVLRRPLSCGWRRVGRWRPGRWASIVDVQVRRLDIAGLDLGHLLAPDAETPGSQTADSEHGTPH